MTHRVAKSWIMHLWLFSEINLNRACRVRTAIATDIYTSHLLNHSQFQSQTVEWMISPLHLARRHEEASSNQPGWYFHHLHFAFPSLVFHMATNQPTGDPWCMSWFLRALHLGLPIIIMQLTDNSQITSISTCTATAAVGIAQFYTCWGTLYWSLVELCNLTTQE